MLLYAVPPLRRFRRWYWRLALVAALVGAGVGLAMEYLERRDTDFMDRYAAR